MKKKNVFIFDMDDTLYDRAKPFGKALEEITGKKAGRELRTWYGVYSKCSQEMFEANARGEVSLEDSRILRIRNAAAELQIPLSEEQERAFQSAYERAQSSIYISEPVKQMLDLCKNEDIAMGILTNGPCEHQKKKAKVLQLETWFLPEQILISEGIGYTKPDPEAFHCMERAMQTDPQDTYMIGDSYKSDIAGAMHVGWHTVWLNKDGAQLSGKERQPDQIAETEEQLLEVIRHLMMH